MSNANNIKIKELKINDLHDEILVDFNRYQETTHVKYKDDHAFKIKEDKFNENWDQSKKVFVIQSLKNSIETGGMVIGAFLGSKLIGFANVEGTLFGSKNQYIELPYIHVSYAYRGKGIGEQLFNFLAKEAKRTGALKLYIGAHPAIETQRFYERVGCKPASEINHEIFNREPLDLQLEYDL